MLQKIIKLVEELAPGMKSGIIDPLSHDKLLRECAELQHAIVTGDEIDILLEIADIVYYLGKGMINGMIPLNINHFCILLIEDLGLDIDTVLAITRAKYELRLRGIKDHNAERQAIKDLLS